MSDASRPRAFRLDAPGLDMPVAVEEQVDAFALVEQEAIVEVAQKRGFLARLTLSWGGIFWAALSALLSLAASLWIAQIVEALFARAGALGWFGVALAALAALAALVIFGRECAAVFRQRAIARLHAALDAARRADDRDAARGRIAELVALYAARPETARARAHLAELAREIIDGRDIIDIAERSLMHPLDERARREIANAAKRVSLVTAIAPRAIIDVLFVTAQIVRLIRRIAEVYGGRPGLFGFIKLARAVGSHLAITGGMAAGDSLLQQVVGHGVAAKISARLGEGVLNGLLTARVGLSALAVCRPMPFAVEKQPGVKDVAPFLFSKP